MGALNNRMAAEHPVRMLEITDHLLKLASASVVDYEMTKLPFTLKPETWFAMEYIFPNAQRHYSPVWIERVRRDTSPVSSLGDLVGPLGLDQPPIHALKNRKARDLAYTARSRAAGIRGSPTTTCSGVCE